MTETQLQAWKVLTRQLSSDRGHHAYLFATANIEVSAPFIITLAKYILCQGKKQNEPCDSCKACHLFDLDNHPDYVALQDNKTISVDAIRDFTTFFHQTGTIGREKVGVILCADALNVSSANALLKTLEEPVANSHLLLLANNAQQLPATIRSRCQMMMLDDELAPLNNETLEKLVTNLHECVVDHAAITRVFEAIEIESGPVFLRNMQRVILDILKVKAGMMLSTPCFMQMQAIANSVSTETFFKVYDEITELLANKQVAYNKQSLVESLFSELSIG